MHNLHASSLVAILPLPTETLWYKASQYRNCLQLYAVSSSDGWPCSLHNMIAPKPILLFSPLLFKEEGPEDKANTLAQPNDYLLLTCFGS